MNIDYSPEFARRFKKLPQELKFRVVEKEKIFRKNYRDFRLKTHKLSGKFKGRMAFWVDFKTRIIFSLINPRLAHFLSIGSHDIYK